MSLSHRGFKTSVAGGTAAEVAFFKALPMLVFTLALRLIVVQQTRGEGCIRFLALGSSVSDSPALLAPSGCNWPSWGELERWRGLQRFQGGASCIGTCPWFLFGKHAT